MPNDHIPPEELRQHAEGVREQAEDSRQTAEQGRAFTEERRVSAESARSEAEQFRRLAEEARPLHDDHRDALEAVRQGTGSALKETRGRRPRTGGPKKAPSPKPEAPPVHGPRVGRPCFPHTTPPKNPFAKALSALEKTI